ncbi:MAG: hypothetical protein JXB07_07455 [Anaerolineae bacterium]|nr:hypothetical protein [Anaerolineae bacterium]
MAGHARIDAILGSASIIILTLTTCATPPTPWQIYAFDGTFVQLPDTNESIASHPVAPSPLPTTPTDWEITAAALADVTGDDEPEWVLLVWRPWQDWPIQEWVSAPSPISAFHDTSGDSCHLILLDPDDGREIWAGSALPAPLLALAVGDVDGDGLHEVVTLEGDYNKGRSGPAGYINVWAWNDFGFSLEWRSPEGIYRELALIDAGSGELAQIAVR